MRRSYCSDECDGRMSKSWSTPICTSMEHLSFHVKELISPHKRKKGERRTREWTRAFQPSVVNPPHNAFFSPFHGSWSLRHGPRRHLTKSQQIRTATAWAFHPIHLGRARDGTRDGLSVWYVVNEWAAEEVAHGLLCRVCSMDGAKPSKR
ncbi:uncharacterized protein BJX67DRAFT_41352 [Aspergillus lucknowensis]|uniref:C2H2-type domain-containing protein n=1 Tax=Aspergillus lucknowensis TaxID=176173 RepID=A0ABR4LVG0_9EURO